MDDAGYGVETCKVCGVALRAEAVFCTQCGEPTSTQRRKIEASWQRQAARQQRAAYAITWIFLATIATIFAASRLEGFQEPAQAIGLFLVGLGGVSWLGKGASSRCLGTRPKVEHFFLGVFGGVVCFILAHLYVRGLFVLFPSLDAKVQMEPSWWFVLLVAPFFEEWLIRGVAWDAASRLGRNRFTLALTTVLFALIHGLNGGFYLEFPHRFSGGLLLGWIRLRTGSLWPAVAGHFVWNATALFLGE